MKDQQFTAIIDKLNALTAAVAALSLRMDNPTPGRKIEPDTIYTTETAAKALSVHPDTLTRWLRAGVIKGNRKLGSWRIKGSELLRQA
ncbi:MAG: helix-turn-helix domain-containing protein [Undibacterium sp.]|nr:helix-turn-helix domain-containing protein [Opitutaceae bacterium]